ncbi:MAG: intracellular sulfur oxidation DsrE/DsrF family protein [Burkholderiaceae bacterium]
MRAATLALALRSLSFAAHPVSATKVVVQISNDAPRTWSTALNNADNVLAAIPGAEVDTMVYDLGIGMLKAESTVANRVAKAVSSGIKVVACENTIRKAKLNPQDMHADIGYVPSGVVEIMAQQGDGWSYLRPWVSLCSQKGPLNSGPFFATTQARC